MSWWGVFWFVLALWALGALIFAAKMMWELLRPLGNRPGRRKVQIIDNLKQGLPPYGADPESFEEALDEELRAERADPFSLLLSLFWLLMFVVTTLGMFLLTFCVLPFAMIKELGQDLLDGSIWDWSWTDWSWKEREDDYFSRKKPDSVRFDLFVKEQRENLQGQRRSALGAVDWRSLGVPPERREAARLACEEILERCLAQFRREREQVSSFDDFLVIQRWKGGGSASGRTSVQKCREEMNAVVERLVVGAPRRDAQ